MYYFQLEIHEPHALFIHNFWKIGIIEHLISLFIVIQYLYSFLRMLYRTIIKHLWASNLPKDNGLDPPTTETHVFPCQLLEISFLHKIIFYKNYDS